MKTEEIVKVYEAAKKTVMNEIAYALNGTKANLEDMFPTALGFIIGISFVGGYVRIVYRAETDLNGETFSINLESKTIELTHTDKKRQFFCDFGAFMANESAINQIKIIMRTWHSFYKALHEIK